MNLLFILILTVPLVEIFLMIKIGHVIGALNTILLIIFTAIAGVYFALHPTYSNPDFRSTPH